MILKLILSFLRPKALDFADAGAGIGAGIIGNYDALTMPRPDYFTGTRGPEAENEFMAALQAISAATDRNTGMIDPQLLSAYGKMLGIDMSPLITSGAVAGDQYKQLAQRGTDIGNTMMGQGTAISNAAFDPQGNLHDYLKQQTIDSSRAADSARGIAAGGASAGNESTALRNFELDWQNRQLGRQIAGNEGAQQAYGAGYNYAAGVPGTTMKAASVPIQAQATAYGAPMAFSDQFLGAERNLYSPYSTIMASAYPYMNMVTSGGSTQYGQRIGRERDVNNMLIQAVGQFDKGFSGNSGMGDPMNWVTMGGMPSGGGGGGGAGLRMPSGGY